MSGSRVRTPPGSHGHSKDVSSAGHETGDTAHNRLGHRRWYVGHRPPYCLTGCGARKNLALPNGGLIPSAHTNAGLVLLMVRRGAFQASDVGSIPSPSTSWFVSNMPKTVKNISGC